MLNLVPIQFLALFGYAILRITVGVIWCYLALIHFDNRKDILPTLNIPIFPWQKTALTMIIITEAVAGLLFILGLFTQLAAIITIIWCLKLLIMKKTFSHNTFPNRLTLLLLLSISVTLFITGAGVPAFDLPV